MFHVPERAPVPPAPSHRRSWAWRKRRVPSAPHRPRPLPSRPSDGFGRRGTAAGGNGTTKTRECWAWKGGYGGVKLRGGFFCQTDRNSMKQLVVSFLDPLPSSIRTVVFGSSHRWLHSTEVHRAELRRLRSDDGSPQGRRNSARKTRTGEVVRAGVGHGRVWGVLLGPVVRGRDGSRVKGPGGLIEEGYGRRGRET